jgi:hypothetical protein
MRWLLFLSRLAFIANVFFLLALSLKIANWIQQPDVVATILIIGYFMVALLNPIVNFCYLLLFIIRRKLLALVPVWLITANVLFLILQICYILYLNDTKHT